MPGDYANPETPPPSRQHLGGFHLEVFLQRGETRVSVEHRQIDDEAQLLLSCEPFMQQSVRPLQIFSLSLPSQLIPMTSSPSVIVSMNMIIPSLTDPP